MFFFFFQAEDGIRDYKVTGVQTCALPISAPGSRRTRSCTSGRREWEWDGRTGGRTSPPGPLTASRRGGTGVRTPVRPLSSEPPRNVRLGLLLRRFGEQLFGAPDLHEVPQIKEGRVIGDARGLLEVVRHDADRVAGLELVAQLLDVLGAGRVERRRGLVEQQNVWLGGERPRHAEALLLAAGEREGAVPQPIFHLVPKRGPAQRALDGGIHLGAGPPAVHP